MVIQPQVCDNGFGELVAAKVAACMRGRTRHGLANFSASAIGGPVCISGSLAAAHEARAASSKEGPKSPWRKGEDAEMSKERHERGLGSSSRGGNFIDKARPLDRGVPDMKGVRLLARGV